MNVKTYCFEVYKSNVPAHEGLLRDICVEASNLNQASESLNEVVKEKYSFPVFWVKKSEG